MKTSITKEHLEFIIRTKRKVSYSVYRQLRHKWHKDDDIEKMEIKWWGYKWEHPSITDLYAEAKKEWFAMSYSYFYTNRKDYIKDNKLIIS